MKAYVYQASHTGTYYLGAAETMEDARVLFKAPRDARLYEAVSVRDMMLAKDEPGVVFEWRATPGRGHWEPLPVANPNSVPAYELSPVRKAFEATLKSEGFNAGTLAFHHEDLDRYASPWVQARYLDFMAGYKAGKAAK